jgi:MFS family permease
MMKTYERRSPRSFDLVIRLMALALTAIAISCNFTNYGAVMPSLEYALHATDGELGLFSTTLYGAIAGTYLLGGFLTDRWGARRVLMWALLMMGVGNSILPLIPSLAWTLGCRTLIGLGAGAAIIAGSQMARHMGRYAAFGQGFYGGMMQMGAGLGMFGSAS